MLQQAGSSSTLPKASPIFCNYFLNVSDNWVAEVRREKPAIRVISLLSDEEEEEDGDDDDGPDQC